MNPLIFPALVENLDQSLAHTRKINDFCRELSGDQLEKLSDLIDGQIKLQNQQTRLLEELIK